MYIYAICIIEHILAYIIVNNIPMNMHLEAESNSDAFGSKCSCVCKLAWSSGSLNEVDPGNKWK